MSHRSPGFFNHQVEKKFERIKPKVESLLKNKEKAKATVEKAEKKAKRVRNIVKTVYHQLKLMFLLTKDYIRGDYRDIPFSSILIIMSGIFYFLLPTDVIFDFIPLAGYVDDLLVLKWVIDQVKKNLEKYEIWRKQKND